MEESRRDSNEINEESSIEQVRLTVPTTDDPTLPVITFRTWVLGPMTCSISAFMIQYFTYRQNRVFIPTQCLNLLILPIGKLMAATLPTKAMRLPGTKWAFSLNPGTFNMKEHALISIFASSEMDNPLGLDVLVLSKVFYKKNVNIWLAILLTFTTYSGDNPSYAHPLTLIYPWSQMSGYGFAGIFMNILVDSPLMWWPLSLVNVALFRSLHEVEVRSKGHLKSLQFLLLVSVSSFAYYIVPNYFFPSISALSVVCWIWKNSVIAQHIGLGRFGLGIGSIAIDWSSISGLFGNPLAAPMFAIINTMDGFILFQYIITPIAYWSNTYNAKRFPFSSYDLFDFDGQVYNITRVMNDIDFTLNKKEYADYSKIYTSTMFTYSNGFSFAILTSTLTDFVLFHTRDTLCQLKQAYKGDNSQSGDVHNRLMKKYNSISHWWFYVILFTTVGLSFLTSSVFGELLQLPYWIPLLGYLLVLILLLPFGIIQATTGQSLSLSLISEMTIGYISPGKPLANMAFKAYGESTISHALTFISDLKLGHYMKIPPKSMFLIQICGTIFASLTHFITAWWIISTVDNMCDVKKLPVGNPWTCPTFHGYFNNNVIWGLVGPSRVYAPHGMYSGIYYFFAVGIIVSVLACMLLRLFPKTKWIRFVNIPMILAAPTFMPNTGPVIYWSAFLVALFFNCIVYKRYKGWWAKYNYLLASGLDLGIAFMALLTGFTLNPFGIYGVSWWGLDINDHCPLAKCPMAPGVQVSGCPVY